MAGSNQKTMYRIGDYARYMGVSPDLLKHYEKLGLIRSESPENGYRYYSFSQSISLLECMRMRNYGFSLREIGQVMKELPFREVQAVLDKQIDDLEKRVRFEQLIIQEHRRISAWMDMMASAELLVIEKEAPPVLFLPQSQQRDFIHDERISRLLEAWVNAMPMVKLSRLVPDILSPDEAHEGSWGLMVTEESARQLELPLNDVVRRIPGGRYLHIHFRQRGMRKEDSDALIGAVRGALQARGLQPSGATLQVGLMTLNADHDAERCGWFAIPVDADDNQ